jgi:RNA polymerase sigma-70 factor (ECF subfamily)
MSAPPENSGVEPSALIDWFDKYRDRLRTMVALRLDRRLSGRIDPSDVLQESYLEAAQRWNDYQRAPSLTPYLWLRFLTMQRLLILHRRHLQTQSRDAALDVSLDLAALDVSSDGLAQCLIDSGTSPSQQALRADDYARLHQALDQMESVDREVLALRHFEQLSNDETAEVLGIQPGAASQRYYRALHRLKDLLTPSP